MKTFTVHRETIKAVRYGCVFLETTYYAEETPDAILGAGDRGPGWYRWQVILARDEDGAVAEAKAIWKEGLE